MGKLTPEENFTELTGYMFLWELASLGHTQNNKYVIGCGDQMSFEKKQKKKV